MHIDWETKNTVRVWINMAAVHSRSHRICACFTNSIWLYGIYTTCIFSTERRVFLVVSSNVCGFNFENNMIVAWRHLMLTKWPPAHCGAQTQLPVHSCGFVLLSLIKARQSEMIDRCKLLYNKFYCNNSNTK